MANDGETVETVADFILGGSKITADDYCSHEIKRYLLLGGKVMTNLESMLKSRDITLPTNVRLVKATVFPVVMYGCESWTIKKSWAQKNWCFWTVVLGKILESPLDCKEIQPVHPRGNQSWCSLEGLILKLKLQYFGHLMRRADSLEKTLMLGKSEGRRRRGRQRMRWLDAITDSMDMGLGELRELACCDSWGCKESDTTERLNWTSTRASWMAQWVKNLPATQETQVIQVWFLGQEDRLEKEMATYFNILAEKSMDREVWWATVQSVAKSQTRLSDQVLPRLLL